MIKVFASNNINDLNGEGLEYLLDQDGMVIAVFSEGNFLNYRKPEVNNEINEVTKIA
jgi:hypothetical protein